MYLNFRINICIKIMRNTFFYMQKKFPQKRSGTGVQNEGLYQTTLNESIIPHFLKKKRKKYYFQLSSLNNIKWKIRL